MVGTSSSMPLLRRHSRRSVYGGLKRVGAAAALAVVAAVAMRSAVGSSRSAFVLPEATSVAEAQLQGRRQVLQASAAAAALAAVAATPEDAWAVKSKSKWAGSYDDPLHPGCERTVFVSFDGKTAKVAGRSSSEGARCSTGTKEYKWSLMAELADADADEMLIEEAFASITKREVKLDESKWPAVTAKWVDGSIVFPDGIKWKKKSGKAGR
eukprot:TRINITY_DN3233_c0_g1_i1.p1 TRINITY_DN3233_c0_g1~~TRINITY_DN3233_c0_g1_i1.p1  ORF type:complete len:211 (-),score=69.77 TRINITY_DN3233_c0_g1_i1:319-951(-)